MAGLGMENFAIPDSAVKASSQASGQYKAGNGRLHLRPSGSVYGGWVAGTQNQQQWFQVDFRNWTKVTRVATQGRENADHWVTKYRLSYSYDGVFFKNYREDGTNDKVNIHVLCRVCT